MQMLAPSVDWPACPSLGAIVVVAPFRLIAHQADRISPVYLKRWKRPLFCLSCISILYLSIKTNWTQYSIMGLQHLLAVLLFMTLFQYSTSTPILERRKVDPDGWVDYYNDEFQGIYWQEAWDTCTEREFKLIADTAEMVSRRFMSPDVNNGQPDRETAGWTRFFAGKAVSYPWTVSNLYLGSSDILDANDKIIGPRTRLTQSLQKHSMWDKFQCDTENIDWPMDRCFEPSQELACEGKNK